MPQELLTEEEGNLLLKIARENISCYINNEEYNLPDDMPGIFNQKRGVFVTLNKHGQLRGCTGYIEPYKPLIEALLDISISSSVGDPRFRPLTQEELKEIDIEISILTKPEEIVVKHYENYLTKIKVGLDGLIIESGRDMGVLLPQVPIEQNWDIHQFLENLCYKASLYRNAWKDDDTRIYKFRTQIFQE